MLLTKRIFASLVSAATVVAPAVSPASAPRAGWRQVAEIMGSAASISPNVIATVYEGRTYLYTRSVNGWHPQGELVDTGTGALGAQMVAISGDTIVVGAPLDNMAGRAYVFGRTATRWHLESELVGSDTGGVDALGTSVAVWGGTIAVGAPYAGNGVGRAYVFSMGSKGWHQAAELKGIGTKGGSFFGATVAIWGSTVVVGAPGAHRAYLFARGPTGWHLESELTPSSDTRAVGFGSDVAMSGPNVLVGSLGQVFVFTSGVRGWEQTAKISGAGTTQSDEFGTAVAVSGSTAVVGAPGAPNGTEVGRAFVFTNRAAGWHQAAELSGTGTVSRDIFGSSVAVSGSTVVVGNGTPENARSYVFDI